MASSRLIHDTLNGWKSHAATPHEAINHFKPGMSIYLSSGAAEPGTMIRHLMDPCAADYKNDGNIIAEARFIRINNTSSAEIVFVVDEDWQRSGIATYIYQLLVRLARARGITEFIADVLFSNVAMMKVFQKGNLPIKACLEEGIYHLSIPLN